MSIQKDMKEVTDPSDLTDDEYRILQDQYNLPAGFPFRPELGTDPGRPNLSEVANTGTVAVMSIEELEAEIERRQSEQKTPKISDNGGIDDEDDEGMDSELEGVPYDEAPWTNDTRRAELSRRELSVNGDKATLSDRLERSDNDMLEDDDYAEQE